MTDLINQLRDTASKGVSVWGDLQMEAAKEIEILTAEREAYASAMDRMMAGHEDLLREVLAYRITVENLQAENADLKTEAAALRVSDENLLAELAAMKNQPAETEFLFGGLRFKMNFNKAGNATNFHGVEEALQGQWVALVAAENDRHLKAAPTQPLSDAARKLVEQQANDEKLWFIAQTAPEAYLQAELRKLHAAVEAPTQPRELSDDEIRTILMAHGFKIYEGLTDLKPYVYAAVRAVLAAARGKA